MFRDDKITAISFQVKFQQLKQKFDAREEIHLDSEYHQQVRAYIMRLYTQTCETDEFTDKNFTDIREAEMSNLNRLQKLKNATSYKKDKHKSQQKNEDWG
jgi:hypothetical protein